MEIYKIQHNCLQVLNISANITQSNHSNKE